MKKNKKKTNRDKKKKKSFRILRKKRVGVSRKKRVRVSRKKRVRVSRKKRVKILKKKQSKILRKKRKFKKNIKKKIFKIKKSKNKIDQRSKKIILSIIRFKEKIESNFKFDFDLDKSLQNFFQGISNKVSSKINVIKEIIEEDKQRKKADAIKKMQSEKAEEAKRSKIERQIALEKKQREFKDEIKFERERKKELQKFIRFEQAEVRKEQAEKQRKFLEQIKLEKKIEKFRKREAQEIKQLEKFVLSQERESYSGVEERINQIKLKYQALRDQKIRERVESLGVDVDDNDDRAALLQKEAIYNQERQKIEFALESFFRSAHSLVFQINKKFIPKYLSIMRCIDKRFETGEIYIKWDEAPEEEWLILIYIKNNSPDEGIVIEDKTNPEKNISHEYKSNEIFKASDMMVDSLTKLLDTERNKRKSN